MKKLSIVGVLLAIFLPFVAQSTHKYGGQITATAQSCQSNRYTITVISYEDPGSDVEFGSGILNLGFGDPITLNEEADNIKEIIEDGDVSIIVSKLVLSDVIFPSPGEYTITYREFNRNADVVNIRNSVNTPFYIESKLIVDPLLCNSTPQFLSVSNYLAYTNSTFTQRLGAYDPDGDSLSLELVVPEQDTGVPADYLGAPLDINLRYADNPTNAEGTGLPTFELDTGALVWDAPNLPGDFAFALRVNEWRQVGGEWLQLGYITLDFSILVLDTVNNISHTDIITSTAEEKPNRPKVRLYPNPTEGEFTLEVNDDLWRASTATLHNVLGQEIDRRAVLLGENRYSIPEFQPGVYLLTLRQGHFQNVVRFVKK